MSDINAVQARRFKSAETQRHNREIDKIKKKHKMEFDKIKKTNQIEIERVQKESEIAKTDVELKSQSKVKTLRTKQEQILKSEKARLDGELQNLQSVHKDKVLEVKMNQKAELDSLLKSHNTTLENAREKFIKEKIKWQTE